MWFKNLQVYRLPAAYVLAAYQLEEFLVPNTFASGTSIDMQAQGWAPPRDNGKLVHEVDGQLLIKLVTEKKLLPSSVVNQVAKEKALKIEEQQGFKPGRKQIKEIKEQVIDELLPRAFRVQSSTNVWIDPVNGWLVIDASSPSKADDVVSMLVRGIDGFPLQALRVNRTPASAMTNWLASDEAPSGFTVDQDTELRSTGENKSTVRYIRQTLEADDMQRHIGSGKQCTKLAMTWADRISFVLTESLAIKRVSPLDEINERADAVIASEDECFDSDFLLMTGELNRMLSDLVACLSGELASK